MADGKLLSQLPTMKLKLVNKLTMLEPGYSRYRLTAVVGVCLAFLVRLYMPRALASKSAATVMALLTHCVHLLV